MAYVDQLMVLYWNINADNKFKILHNAEINIKTDNLAHKHDRTTFFASFKKKNLPF